MGSPSPPAPMNAASVAAPTVMTAAVRTPAMITGAASGRRTCSSRCLGVMPSASAASTAAGSASRTPVYVPARYREECVQPERDQCGDDTDAQQRYHEREQRDARDRLEYAKPSEDRLREPAGAFEREADWNRDE